MNDGSLVDLMVRDPDDGLVAVYERYADRIHDYCRSILRDDADAADAVQDTFLAASARIGQLRDPERLRPWLYAIARNRSHRTLRDRKRQRPIDDIDQAVSAADPIDSRRLESAEAQALVWEAAEGLDDPDRDVLDLHLRHGLSGADLAAALGTTAPKANQALHRMRERLNRSVGAALAIRYGRSDCDELRHIVGQDSLTPLLRKRVARHLERCEVCERHRHAGAAIYATVPIVGVPNDVWAALASAANDPAAAEQAASAIDWSDSGFPAGQGVGPPQPLQRAARQLFHEPINQSNRSPLRRRAGRRPGVRPPIAGAAAAVVVLLAVGALLLIRSGAGTVSTESLATPQLTPTTVSEIDTIDSSGSVGRTSPSISTVTEEPPPTTAIPPTVTAAPPGSSPSTGGSSSTAGPTLPTVTFIADGQAPSMDLAVDCRFPIVITVTLDDNVDPEPDGDLEVAWPPGRTRSLPTPLSGAVQQVVLQGDDLAGLSGLVNFNVSGRITDQAGNISDVSDSVSCIFIED